MSEPAPPVQSEPSEYEAPEVADVELCAGTAETASMIRQISPPQ